MSRERLRLRYGNEVAGVFVLLAIGLLIWGITQVGDRSDAWTRGAGKLRYRVELPPTGAYGLRLGSRVRVLGADVGSVKSIDMDDEGRMTARIAISDKFRPIVTATSEVRLKREYGVAGDTFIEITRGDGPSLPDGETLTVVSEPSRELEGFVEGLVNEIRNEAIPTLRDLRTAAQEYAQLARALRDPDKELQRLLANLRGLTGTMREGKGTVGRLINDPDLADRLQALVDRADGAVSRADAFFEELRAGAVHLKEASKDIRDETEQAKGLVAKTHRILDEAQRVLADIRAASKRLPDIAEGADKGIDALPGLILQTQATLREVERLVEALQRHWLVRRHVEKAPPGRIAPEEAGGKR
ncbi:MAG: MlaD family protein [Planctomycetota bacterium]|nr:MlaD family protein [Planctomycetota bacterium]